MLTLPKLDCEVFQEPFQDFKWVKNKIGFAFDFRKTGCWVASGLWVCRSSGLH